MAWGYKLVLAPEVDSALKCRPGWGTRIPGVGLRETGVGFPHDLLQLPELAKEAGVAVVDALRCLIHFRMNVALNVPDTVGQSTSTSACNFLLLEPPFWELDLV